MEAFVETLSQLSGISLAVLSALGNSSCDIIKKGVGSRMAALEAVVGFSSIQALFILALHMDRIPTIMTEISSKFWFYVIGSGVINVSANVLYVKSMQVSPMSVSIPFLSFNPVVQVPVSWMLLGEVPTSPGLVGIVVVTLGAFTLGAVERALKAEEETDLDLVRQKDHGGSSPRNRNGKELPTLMKEAKTPAKELKHGRLGVENPSRGGLGMEEGNKNSAPSMAAALKGSGLVVAPFSSTEDHNTEMDVVMKTQRPLVQTRKGAKDDTEPAAIHRDMEMEHAMDDDAEEVPGIFSNIKPYLPPLGGIYMLIVCVLWSVGASFDAQALGLVSATSAGKSSALIYLAMQRGVMAASGTTILMLTNPYGLFNMSSAPGLLAIGALGETCTLLTFLLAIKAMHVSYVIAIKRGGGVLVTVILGALLFGEKNLSRRLPPVFMMVVGVGIIVIFGKS